MSLAAYRSYSTDVLPTEDGWGLPAVPAGTLDGDLLLAYLWWSGGDLTPDVPAGFSEIVGMRYASGTFNARFYQKIAASESGPYSFTTAAGHPGRVTVYAIDNPAASPIGDGASQKNASGTSCPVPAITTTARRSLAFLGCTNLIDTVGGEMYTPPAGYTQRMDADGQVAADKEIVDLGTDVENLEFTIAPASETISWAVEIKSDLCSGSLSYTLDGVQKLLSMDATGVAPPAGRTITSYDWDWGDTETGIGALASHIYAAGGVYTVTLTVTLSDASTDTFTLEVRIMNITDITPIRAIRADDTITLTGTSFGASQGTNTLKIGAIAVTNVVWADTSITCKAGATTPYGAQDVVIATAGGAALASWVGGVYIYDATDNEDAAEVDLGLLSSVYINGLHVGFTEDTFSFQASEGEFRFKPNSRLSAVKRFVIDQGLRLRFTISQINGLSLGQALNADWDSVNRVLTLQEQSTPDEYSVLVVDAAGVVYSFPKCQNVAPPEFALDASRNQSMRLELEAFAVKCGSSYQFMYAQFPA